VASQSFSERLAGRAATILVSGGLITALVVLALGAAGCVTVRPEDKGLLAQPSMSFGSDGRTRAHDEHIFSNREGSYGAGGVSGGGCGCN